MDPIIFVALVLFAAVIVLWVTLPGSIEAQPEPSNELMPALSGQQQA
ncbi:MAG TPA: hypothetical protein VFT66_09155 [Roseiflexaceae bacterium]|jgi:hypothetical protein|nr:hypothetical protein [Roseiflexaceae bacterium]